MADALATIVTLRAFCAERHPRGSPAALLADGIARYLEARGAMTLDEAFSLKPGRGQSPWWRLERRQLQRKAAQDLVEAFGDAPAALRGLRRHARKRSERTHADAQRIDGRARAAQDYLTVAGEVPSSARTLRRIVADNK